VDRKNVMITTGGFLAYVKIKNIKKNLPVLCGMSLALSFGDCGVFLHHTRMSDLFLAPFPEINQFFNIVLMAEGALDRIGQRRHRKMRIVMVTQHRSR
jgi:hypothetical protein